MAATPNERLLVCRLYLDVMPTSVLSLALWNILLWQSAISALERERERERPLKHKTFQKLLAHYKKPTAIINLKAWFTI